MKNYFLYSVFIIIIGVVAALSKNVSPFINYVAPFASPSHKNWWNRMGWERFGYPAFSYWESFENHMDRPMPLRPEISPVLEFPPNTPNSADLYNSNPYHLLSDEFAPPREKESISCVNSRSCYATDFNSLISKTGNYRQMTNNYKHNYPDSCSAPYQELVLNFYKTSPLQVPEPTTGHSVSEAY
jgi:hypothetical protein